MKMKDSPHRHKRMIIIILAALFALTSVALLFSNLPLTVSRYTVVSGKAAGAFRIVLLSDLHGREFGENNSRLLEKIAGEEPDIIALAGDIIDSGADEDQVERVCAFIEKAGEIAPVWFGLGNHEASYMSANGDSLLERIGQAGAVVLEAEYRDVEINGTPVRIGGYGGYYRTPHLNSQDPARQEADMRFFEEFEDTDRFKLLLNHIPTNWLDWDYRDKTPVDLVLSGHYHGGNVRIPFTRYGLYAPYVGWFPPYTKGLFEGEEAACVLTTGLTGGNGYPRLFNPPEIVTVDVVPQEPGE